MLFRMLGEKGVVWNNIKVRQRHPSSSSQAKSSSSWSGHKSDRRDSWPLWSYQSSICGGLRGHLRLNESRFQQLLSFGRESGYFLMEGSKWYADIGEISAESLWRSGHASRTGTTPRWSSCTGLHQHTVIKSTNVRAPGFWMLLRCGYWRVQCNEDRGGTAVKKLSAVGHSNFMACSVDGSFVKLDHGSEFLVPPRLPIYCQCHASYHWVTLPHHPKHVLSLDRNNLNQASSCSQGSGLIFHHSNYLQNVESYGRLDDKPVQRKIAVIPAHSFDNRCLLNVEVMKMCAWLEDPKNSCSAFYCSGWVSVFLIYVQQLWMGNSNYEFPEEIDGGNPKRHLATCSGTRLWLAVPGTTGIPPSLYLARLICTANDGHIVFKIWEPLRNA